MNIQEASAAAQIDRQARAAQACLAGYWSRRITDEHCVVYRSEKEALPIAQLRYHY